MKKVLLISSLMALLSAPVQAGLWEDTKDLAADAWKSTKETASDLKDQAIESWNDTSSSSDEEESGKLADIKKLADKETYVKAWEDIKDSAKNPENAETDENGIPLEE